MDRCLIAESIRLCQVYKEPIKRANLIHYPRQAGFEGPRPGGKHEFVLKGDLRVVLARGQLVTLADLIDELDRRRRGVGEKKLVKFPAKDQDNIAAALRVMTDDPFSGDIVKLETKESQWRRRVDNHRILFSVDTRLGQYLKRAARG